MLYAAQENPQIDTATAEKGRFRMKTNYFAGGRYACGCGPSPSGRGPDQVFGLLQSPAAVFLGPIGRSIVGHVLLCGAWPGFSGVFRA